jgi:hypothetical protein
LHEELEIIQGKPILDAEEKVTEPKKLEFQGTSGEFSGLELVSTADDKNLSSLLPLGAMWT